MQKECNTYRRCICQKNAIYNYVLILLKILINLDNLGKIEITKISSRKRREKVHMYKTI